MTTPSNVELETIDETVAGVRAFYDAITTARKGGLGHAASAMHLFVDRADVFHAWLIVLGPTAIRSDLTSSQFVEVRNAHVIVNIPRNAMPGIEETRSVTVRSVRWPDEVPAS